ncbi:oligosaccharide flippase family protein [Pseudalkalibacillus hwajinpoensis]|uniref:oligosaccharide flippase family protein n=1 Tax=Guptibacillus hwajinpoensis TaxID=208199 RepID=UPI00325B8612
MNFKKISISSSMKNVGKISFGTILGQLISIISLPIFTRLYGVEVIGYFALFNATAIIVKSFSDLGLTNAIMIEESEESAGKTYKVVSTVSLIISSIVGVCVYTFSEVFFGTVDINNIFVAVTITILIFTSQQIQLCYTWLNRRKQYDVLMKNPIINNTIASVLGLILGLIGFLEYGYYISIMVGQIFTIVHMKRFLPKGFFCFDTRHYLQSFKKHKNFLTYQMPSNIFLQIKGQLPILLISIFFGSKILGYYSVSMRVLGMPITLLANSLGKVFFQRVSELNRKGEQVGEFTLLSLEKAMKISFIPIVMMLSLGDLVTALLFGEDYIVSGNILRVMTLYGFFLFLSMSVNGVAIVIDKQKYLLVSGFFQILGISSGVWLGAKIFNDIYFSLLGLSMTFIIIQIVYFCAIFKVSNIKIKRYLLPLLKAILVIFVIYFVIRSVLLFLGIVDTY